MRDREDVVDLGFSRLRSDAFFLGAGFILSVLMGAFLVFTAFTKRPTDSFVQAVAAGLGLFLMSSGFGLPHCWKFMRSRLLVDAAGVQLDARGRTTYHWAQIEGFHVDGPHDCVIAISAGAVMRLRDGRHIPLERLGTGSGQSERALAQISERIVTLNRLLAQANEAPQRPRL